MKTEKDMPIQRACSICTSISFVETILLVADLAGNEVKQPVGYCFHCDRRKCGRCKVPQEARASRCPKCGHNVSLAAPD